MCVESGYVDCRYHLWDANRAHLVINDNRFEGETRLAALHNRLRFKELPLEERGRALFEAAFPSGGPLQEGYRLQCALAQHERKRIRFRLHLSAKLPDWVRRLEWEALYDGETLSALARSPDSPFSRYVDAPGPLQTSLSISQPRLLAVVSAPTDAERHGLAHVERELVLGSLRGASKSFADFFESKVLLGPASLNRLRTHLLDDRYVALHFVGHALVEPGKESQLVLQREDGQAHFVGEKLLSEMFLGNRSLRMVALVSCESAVPSGSDQLSGLALSLVRRGLPAVIAMRRPVTVDTAEKLTRWFYRNLGASGCIDGALNETRQELFLDHPQGEQWTDPQLFMRLMDGRLWTKRQQPVPRKQESVERSGSPTTQVNVQSAETVVTIAKVDHMKIRQKR